MFPYSFGFVNFVFIDDVVNAFILLIDQLSTFDKGFFNFQIASGEIVSIRHLLEMIHSLTDSRSILNFGAVPYRKNELMLPETDNASLKSLGWSPSINLQSGLTRTLNYIKSTIHLTTETS